MAANFELNIDRDAVAKTLTLLDGIDYGAEKALFRALKAVQSKAKTRASQMIGQDPRHGLNLKAAYIKDKLKTGKPTYSNLTARLYADKRGILLTRFPYRKAKGKGNGYEVNILRNGGGYKALPYVSLLRGLKNSGADGLASFDVKTGKWKMKYGPSISQALNKHLPKLSDEMGEYALEQVQKQVSGILRQKGF